MNHHVRLRQRATVFTCVCTGCGAVRDQPSRLVSLFCVWGAAGGITKKVKSLPQTNYLTQMRTREDGRGGGGRLKRDGCTTVRVVIQVTLVRARAARAECPF